jgi:hypothetical protein
MNHLRLVPLIPAVALLVLFVMTRAADAANADPCLAADTACYSGPVSAGQNLRLFAAVQGKTVRRLVITSNGGEVEAGIALGLWAHAHKLDIEVREYCLSSCANYVFTAGRRKTIHPGAVVAWHGNYHHLKQTGLWGDDVVVRMERYGENEASARAHVRGEVDRLVRLERDFFARIGVDEYLCWIGKMPPYSVPDYYFLSAPDMAQFGVANVQTPAGYEDTDIPDLAGRLRYIRISDRPGADAGSGPG